MAFGKTGGPHTWIVRKRKRRSRQKEESGERYRMSGGRGRGRKGDAKGELFQHHANYSHCLSPLHGALPLPHHSGGRWWGLLSLFPLPPSSPQTWRTPADAPRVFWLKVGTHRHFSVCQRKRDTYYETQKEYKHLCGTRCVLKSYSADDGELYVLPVTYEACVIAPIVYRCLYCELHFCVLNYSHV